MNQIGARLRALRRMNITDVNDLLPALETWRDEIRNHEEVTGAAMLNETSRKPRTDEIDGTESCQLEVTKPAQNHVD